MKKDEADKVMYYTHQFLKQSGKEELAQEFYRVWTTVQGNWNDNPIEQKTPITVGIPTPHICPLCRGEGLKWDSTGWSSARSVCNGCNGRGIVFG